MNITTTIKTDLARRGPIPLVDTVQGDSYTRAVEVSLYENGALWQVPDGAQVQVRYRKPDGTGDMYETMPDGSSAWAVSGNVLTISLTPQMLTVPGLVETQLLISSGSETVATFSFYVAVERDPSAGVPESRESLSWLNWTTERLEELKDSGQFNGYSIYATTEAVDGNSPFSIAIEDIVIPDDSHRVVVGDLIVSSDGYLLTVASVDELYSTARCSIVSQFSTTGTGLTDEQAEKLDTITVTEDGYTDISGLRKATAIAVVKEEQTVTVTQTLQGDVTSTSVITLDDNDFPVAIVTDGVECAVSWEGFDDSVLSVWEGGSY